jgi:hypothetical protein
VSAQRLMRSALLVGIDEYPKAPLSGCVNDARNLAALLERNEDGSPNFTCRVMLAPGETITRASLRKNVDELLKTNADFAVFFFSGHGTENNLGGYLVTPDARAYDEGVSLTDILTLANLSKIPHVLILLDSCYSGAFGSIPAPTTETLNIRSGISVLTASRASELAVEKGGSGVFTNLVCGALEGGAADPLGVVPAAGVYSYVDQALGPWDQRPLFKAHVSSLVPIRQCRPAVDLDVLRRIPEWFPKPDAEFALDPSFEDTVETHDPEKAKVFKCLQRLRSARLVEPVGEEHMYYAAMNNKACVLTPLGRHYWRLAKEQRI